MYSEIMGTLKTYLQSTITAEPVQVGYYGELAGNLDLRVAAILLDPGDEETKVKSTRWSGGAFNLTAWVITDMSLDYLDSMRTLERVIAAEDQDAEVFGLKASLKQLNRDPDFLNLSGSIGGKTWRIAAGGVATGRTRFGIKVMSSRPVNTAQVELFVNIEIEN